MYPVLYQSNGFVLPTYFVVVSIACCICIWWVAKRADQQNLNRNLALDITLVVLGSGFIGARAFHIFFEYPNIYIESPIRIFKFWEGGFVFFGGALVGSICGLIFAKYKKADLRVWLDFSAPVVALGYAIGRIGCFFAGCCYGKFCTLPWAVVFPAGVEAPNGIPIHPTQLYAVFLESITLSLLLLIEANKSKTNFFAKLYSKPGDVFYLWMMLHGIGRIIMETYRDDFRGNTFVGLSLSTIISLLAVFAGVGLYLFDSNSNWRRNGKSIK